MIYYILFIGLFLSSLFDFTKVNTKFKYNLFIFWLIIFILFKGLRWDTGTDFPQFYNCFKYSEWNNIFSFWRYGPDTTKMEFGYVFINILIKTICPYYTFFLIVTNAFILGSFAYLIRKYTPKYSLIALSIMIVSTEIFPVRQTLVTAILCYSIMFIQKRQLKYYIISIIICFCIHRSSLILLPLYWICRYKGSLKFYILIYLGLIFTRVILTNILSELLNTSVLSIISAGLTDTYMVNDEEISSYSISTILNSLFHILLFMFTYNKYTKQDDRNRYTICINFFFIYLSFNVLGSIPGLTMLYRISNNFIITYPICIAYSINAIKKYDVFIVLALYTVSWGIKLKSNPCINKDNPYYSSCYQPYYSIFDKNLNKELIRSENWPFPHK